MIVPWVGLNRIAAGPLGGPSRHWQSSKLEPAKTDKVNEVKVTPASLEKGMLTGCQRVCS
jgi:hypothetical protein